MSIDALTTAIQKVLFSIPIEILQATFNPHHRRTTIDQCILDDVVNRMVLTDVNIRGGKIVDIVLDLDQGVVVDAPAPLTLGPSASYSVYKIPPHLRENKPIVAAIAIRYPYNVATTGMCNQFSAINSGITMNQLACNVLNSHTFANTVTTPTPILLNGDSIKLEPPQLSHHNWILNCRLAYDTSFVNMDINTIPTFANLIVAATKYYCYNTLVIKMGTTYLDSGRELGVFKERVESYSDQEDKYNELLLDFCGAAMLDHQRLARVLAWY